jgi:hypothetical protein
MKCTDSIMNSQLLCLLLFVIASQLIKPSPFTSLWDGSVSVDFVFMIMPESKENNQKYSDFNNYINIYNQSTTPYYTDANPDEKRCLTASKLIKESEKHNNHKKLLWFLCIVYSMAISDFSLLEYK